MSGWPASGCSVYISGVAVSETGTEPGPTVSFTTVEEYHRKVYTVPAEEAEEEGRGGSFQPGPTGGWTVEGGR